MLNSKSELSKVCEKEGKKGKDNVIALWLWQRRKASGNYFKNTFFFMHVNITDKYRF